MKIGTIVKINFNKPGGTMMSIYEGAHGIILGYNTLWVESVVCTLIHDSDRHYEKGIFAKSWLNEVKI